jgi:hypothetical protein
VNDDPAAGVLESADLVALIGWLAVIEGEIAGGGLTQSLDTRLRARFVHAGLLDVDADEQAFRLAIGEVNQRLRYALGERT